jgi:ribosomal protein S18 acetylase RimI-like enzyme
VEALRTAAETEAAALHDPLLVWAAQGFRPGVRAWAHGDAVAVAAAELSYRDRLVVRGGLGDAVALLRGILPELGPTFRPLGDEQLIRGLVDAVPDLELAGPFAWMELVRTRGAPTVIRPQWLDNADLDDVADLLDDVFPRSYARPGRPGVTRWAGVRGATGTPVSIAADAWSAPRVGFLAGVATHPDARGRGLAAATCRFVVDELLVAHERVGLIVDYWNTGAIGLYRRLGFRTRAVAAARVRPGLDAHL